MKKVILNQISKAVAGGSNYFYLPLHVVQGKDSYYETSADLSKLFELDSNNVPVIKEICVYNDDNLQIVYLSYCGGKGNCNYSNNDSKSRHKLFHNGNSVLFDDIDVVKTNTDETDDDE